MARMVMCFRQHFPALRDVAYHANHQVAGFHVHLAHADLHPSRFAVLGFEAALEAHRFAAERRLELFLEQFFIIFIAEETGDGESPLVCRQCFLGLPQPGGEQTIGHVKFHFIADNENAVVRAIDIGAQQ